VDLTEAALLVGIAGTLLGYLLVVRAGFRREFIWGVLSLVPVVSLAFVALYWQQARLGFLISILGLLVVAGALYGGADARVERELARLGHPVEVPMPVQRPADTVVPNEEIVRRIEEETGQPLELVDESRFNPLDVQPLPPEGSFRVEAGAPVSRVWREAVRAELPQLVGEHLRLRLASGGAVREGRLIEVTLGTVFLRQLAGPGSADFEYRLRDIASLEVWDVEGWQPRLPAPEPEPEPVSADGVIFIPQPADQTAAPEAGS
jgi:hypothetical protein